ncbi:MAG: HAD family hydrolase [Silicimonas sp.]|nr:HAD family hydrolase [Silicimonas sp.]
MRVLSTICFDADDTLWQNERYFRLTEERFLELLADHAEPDHLAERLLDAERRNIERYGYGIKGFTLSMIETALQVTENRVPGEVIAELLAAGKELLTHPVDLLPGAEETVRGLAGRFTLVLITKGDLIDQERKLAGSGLGELFDGVEIVSEKTRAVYRDIFSGRGIAPDTAMMVGNSMKSDVLPVLDAGGWGVHVPSRIAWALEAAEAPLGHPRFREIGALSELPDLIATVTRNI